MCVRLHTLSPALFKPVVVIAVSCDSLAPSSLICWCLWTRVPLYVFLIQETGTHHSSGSRGIPSRPDTFISVKKETEQTRAAVCSILPGGKKREGDWRGKKKKKSFLSAQRECAALRWMRNLLWRRFKGAILHQLTSRGVNRKDAMTRDHQMLHQGIHLRRGWPRVEWV